MVDLIAFLGQSLSYRIDLNARENFIETAQKKESVLRLARLVGYNAKRNIPASGLLKLTGLQTTEDIVDSFGTNLRNRFIIWNDDTNANWLEQMTTVLNNAFTANTTFGRPSSSANIGGIATEQYTINTNISDVPLFNFSKVVSGSSTQFQIVSANVNDTSIYEETPLPGRPFGMVYRNDRRGNSSSNTGFFVHFTQGNLQSAPFNINDPSTNEIININVNNINENDLWLWQLDRNGNPDKEWTKLDNVYGSNVIYNSINKNTRSIYAVSTRDDDQISLNFADGSFGDLPNGSFLSYFRVSNGRSYIIKPSDITNVVVNIPYISKRGQPNSLTLQLTLQNTITNASASEDANNIKINAPQAFYSQNRMITAEDYNTYPLTSNPSIVKAKAVNRASSGISRQFEIQDPTGKYSPTNLISDDGIIYKNSFEVDFTFDFASRNDVLGVLRNQVEPILDSVTTKSFYYDNYPRINTAGLNIDWVKSTNTAEGSTGYFRNAITDAPITVGSFTGNNFRFIATDAMVKFVPPSGRYFLPNGELTTSQTKTTRNYIWTKILNVVGDGSNGGDGALDDGTGPVVLSEKISNLAIPSEIIPNIITDLPTDIETEMIDLIFTYKTFGVRFDQSAQLWKIITNANLNTIDPFSLDREGDLSGTKVDKSWILLFETDGDTYTVTYRGLNYRFDSENLISFYVDERGKSYDSQTGKVIKDQIKILKVNEDPTESGILDKDYQWEITGAVRALDGYEEKNKVIINLFDSDDDGMVDDPDSFINIVSPESTDVRGYKDKFVFFENAQVGNYTVTTKVDATNFVIFDKQSSVSSLSEYEDGQLFYFYSELENVIKQYNATQGALVLNNTYFARPGRSDIKFQYLHNAENDRRLDPSKTNIIDMYVLTENYDNEFRSYINGNTTKPTEPTSEQLRSQFEPVLEKVKSISDTIIFHSVNYRTLFGSDAETSLQASFKVVKTPQSTMSDNEIKSMVIDAINNFFSIENWDFGDTFYFTELATYVHNELAPELANFVIVPRSNSQSFGSLFQLTSKPDEIFISSATVDNVEIIDSLTASNLQASGDIISSAVSISTSNGTSTTTGVTITSTTSNNTGGTSY